MFGVKDEHMVDVLQSTKEDAITIEVGHPVLSENGEQGAAKILRLAATATVVSLILSDVVGDDLEVAKVHTSIARKIIWSGLPIIPAVSILSGGKTTVPLKETVWADGTF